MDSSDITAFANMPRLDVYKMDTVVRENSLKVFDEQLDFIEFKFAELDSLNNQRSHLIIHGSSEDVNVGQSIEAISQTIRSVWESIKAAFLKILEWLGLDSYFSQWLNTSQRRLSEVERLYQTKSKFYTKVDSEAVKAAEVVGFTYSKYLSLLNIVYTLSQKINNTCSGSIVYENINIEQLFGRETTSLGFSYREGQMFEPSSICVERKKIGALGWSPASINNVYTQLHSILLYTIHTDRIGTTLSSIIKESIKMCDDNIDETAASNPNKLIIAKKRLATMKCIRKIIAWDMTYTSIMSRQWVHMVNKFNVTVV